MFKRLLFILALPILSFAQSISPTDSLVQLLKTPIADTTKVLIYEEVALQLIYDQSREALKYAQRGLKLAKDIHYKLGEARCLNRIAIIQRVNGNYSAALQYHYDALAIARELNDHEGISKILSSMGILYAEQNDFKNSIQYYAEARKEAKKVNYQRIIENTLLNTATDYALMGNLDSALTYNQKAYESALETGNNLSIILSNIAEINFKRKNYEQAFENYRASINAGEALGQNHSLSQTYLKFAKLFQAVGQKDSAVFYAGKSLEYSKATQHLEYLVLANRLLSELYEPTDLQRSFAYYKASEVANDSLNSVDKTLRLRQVEFNEEMRKQELEVIREKELAQKKQGILIGLLVGFILLGGIIYRNYLQKAATNKLLKQQNEAIRESKNELEQSLKQLKITQNQLIQSEKLASMGELSAGIAHEIQNPMNFVNNFAEVSQELIEEFREELDKTELPESRKNTFAELLAELETSQSRIFENGKRASGIVQGMLEHSRGKTGERREIDLNKMCDEYLRLSFHGMRAKDKSFASGFELQLDPNLPKYIGVVQELSRVILNLINNAFYAVHSRKKKMSEDYQPMVTVQTVFREKNTLEVRVGDNGEGIAPEIRDKIFQPFFTTKPAGEGSGLGLSISYDIITKGHNGRLEVQSEENTGTTFIVTLFTVS
ncbi:tetratricopeptide repeat-containing sensor histidine kinase [Jiulongibacter sediminis]|uniref:histidine kinase n=1 Tax=Jiulongibacter sediminis TaxID=1605367 RepID=A0A0P7BY44_9BACT|nr:tetratricopeptide repeat protein [Jiulongibacter sediminis]KPM47016.1 hypothetical protein AFM12_17465 [Jiulongibacter sediminis]TBX22358.1 hypothetical protein TK44_17470 [Jiulongibacter sediminis]